MLKPGSFVRYHGSSELNRGYAFKVVGPCDCPRCLRWTPADGVVQRRGLVRLADLISGGMSCVRPWHVTVISEEEAVDEPCVTVVSAYDNYET